MDVRDRLIVGDSSPQIPFLSTAAKFVQIA